MGTKVQFGRREYQVTGQKIGRIRRKLPQALQLVQAAEGQSTGSEEDFVVQCYEGLQVFVPDLAPVWEIAGYMNEADFANRSDPDHEESPYDPDADGSPTGEQIANLLEAIFEVNGGTRLVKLLKAIGLHEAVRAFLRVEGSNLLLNRSQSSQQPSGESDSGSSSMTPSTSEAETTGSPLPAS